MGTRDTRLDRTEIEETVLDAVQKGFTKVSHLVSYCGPELLSTGAEGSERELDVPQVMRAIQRLIQSGQLERTGHRGARQLEVRITDEGRDAAPVLPEREAALLSEYGISLTPLVVLSEVIEYERERGSLPTISQLRSETEESLVTYQMQPIFTRLIDAGMAEARGLFRFKIDPTEAGHLAVEEYDDLLRDS